MKRGRKAVFVFPRGRVEGEEVENHLGGGVWGRRAEEAWRERFRSLPRGRGLEDQAFADGGGNRGNLGPGGRGGGGDLDKYLDRLSCRLLHVEQA